MIGAGIELAERRLLPDSLVRAGTRWLLASQLSADQRHSDEARRSKIEQLRERLRRGPLAVHTLDANQQHYEVPAAFFRLWLGPRMKYSACWWPEGVTDLAAAEDAMLTLTAERAQIENGMRILDLGCGWGSFALWAAAHYPASPIVAVSNSASQRAYIENQAWRLRLSNLSVRTADVNDFAPEQTFDRVVSVEMFEHVRNHEMLMSRVAGWLASGGKLFVHVFSHRHLVYLYEAEGDAGWMGRHFFTGGMMPSHDWLAQFQRDLSLEASWRMSGTHYARTLEAWLARLDRAGLQAVRALGERVSSGTSGGVSVDTARSHQRWRMFLLASAELFAWEAGQAWGVSHYRFGKV